MNLPLKKYRSKRLQIARLRKRLLYRGRKGRIRCEACGVSDFEGHYDVDGVSFTKESGVIVASDGQKKTSLASPWH